MPIPILPSNTEEKKPQTQWTPKQIELGVDTFKSGSGEFDIVINEMKKAGASPEQVTDYERTITQTVAGNVEPRLGNQAIRKLQKERANYINQLDEIPTTGIGRSVKIIELEGAISNLDSQIEQGTEAHLEEIRELGARLNNFQLDFNWDPVVNRDADRFFNAAEAILQAKNPDYDIKIDENGIYVNNRPIEASVWQEMKASGWEIGVGSGVAIASVAAAMKAPGKSKLLALAVAGGTSIAGSVATSFGAEADRDSALEALDIGLTRAHDNQLFNEFLVMDTLYSLGGAGVGKGVHSLYKGYKGLKGLIGSAMEAFSKENHISDDVIDTIKGVRSRDDIWEDTQSWIKSLKEGEKTEVTIADRGFFAKMVGTNPDIPFLTHKEAATEFDPKMLARLDPNDKMFLYLMHTDPNAAKTLSSAVNEFPELNKAWLYKSAAFRGEQVRNQLKNTNFTPDDFKDMMKAINEDIIGNKEALRKSMLGIDGKPLKLNEVEKSNVNSALLSVIRGEGQTPLSKFLRGRFKKVSKEAELQEYTQVYLDTKAKFKDKLLVPADEKVLTTYKDALAGVISDKQFKEGLKATTDSHGMRVPPEFHSESLTEQFKRSLDIEEIDERFATEGLHKALSKPNISKEEILDTLFEVNKTFSLRGDDYNKALSRIKNPETKVKVENGILEAVIEAHSIPVFVKKNVEASVIDFPRLSKALKGFEPQNPDSKALKAYIDETGSIYRNDIHILNIFSQSADVGIGGGPTIAETALGKMKTEIIHASSTFLKQLAGLGGRGPKIALRKSVLRYFSDDPINQKSYNEFLDMITKASEQGAE